MGFRNSELEEYNLKGYDYIVVFDDISTKGSQLMAMNGVLRGMGFAGNIYYLVLGKTLTYSHVLPPKTNHPSMEEARRGRRLVVDTMD